MVPRVSACVNIVCGPEYILFVGLSVSVLIVRHLTECLILYCIYLYFRRIYSSANYHSLARLGRLDKYMFLNSPHSYSALPTSFLLLYPSPFLNNILLTLCVFPKNFSICIFFCHSTIPSSMITCTHRCIPIVNKK